MPPPDARLDGQAAVAWPLKLHNCCKNSAAIVGISWFAAGVPIARSMISLSLRIGLTPSLTRPGWNRKKVGCRRGPDSDYFYTLPLHGAAYAANSVVFLSSRDADLSVHPVADTQHPWLAGQSGRFASATKTRLELAARRRRVSRGKDRVSWPQRGHTRSVSD